MKTGKNKPSRLNKYIANSGVCTRREADELIKSGQISVNGRIILRLGTSINPNVDKVVYNGEALFGALPNYILLNKSKGYGPGGRNAARLLDKEEGGLMPLGELARGYQRCVGRSWTVAHRCWGFLSGT